MEDFKLKLQELCNLLTQETHERLMHENLACKANLDDANYHYHVGNKYARIDSGSSGKLMVDFEGNIYGIKAYGVINKFRRYGTLDTMHQYYWGEYSPMPKDVHEKLYKREGL